MCTSSHGPYDLALWAQFLSVVSGHYLEQKVQAITSYITMPHVQSTLVQDAYGINIQLRLYQ